MRKILYMAFCLLLSVTSVVAQRVQRSVNSGWRFALTDADASAAGFDDSRWAEVSIPHTWNAADAVDDEAGYTRATGWYRRTVRIDSLSGGRRVYLWFEGADQLTTLYVNGHRIGNHAGGYTAFCFDITGAVQEGENLLAVSVDNRYNEDIPPLSADFTFFGGIYRDVYLLLTAPVHLSTTHYASSGVYLTTPRVEDRLAEVQVKSLISNDLAKEQTVVIVQTVVDAAGKTVATGEVKSRLRGATLNQSVEQRLRIVNPVRWEVERPSLYRVYTRLETLSGERLDEVVNPLGIRTYEFSADRGFSLNGRPLKLIGTNRHQDYKGMGNALSDQMHVRDIRLLKEMGGNFLRVSHYPQDPVVMDECSRNGILSSVEIPIVNAITPSEAFLNNCVEMAREMVYQNFNSPSVVIWAYMNEVLLRPPYEERDTLARNQYYKWVYRIGEAVEKAIREADPARYTMIPCHGGVELYRDSGLSKLPRVLGFNMYNGWYGGNINSFETSLERVHALFPDRPMLLTEYGADVDPRIHNFTPERFDFSCEYGDYYHEHYLPEIMSRPFVAGATVWNLNDFHSESRRDAVPHINNKGLTGLDRERKDTYYFYQASLLKTPVVHICGATWRTRGGVSRQPVKVYSNADEVHLWHNGRDLGVFPVKAHKAELDIDFTEGENRLTAVIESNGQRVSDTYVCHFCTMETGADFKELNVLLGTDRYFEQREAECVWIPERAYEKGMWGYVGGERYRPKTRRGNQPASDADLVGTTDDPMFQTQRQGIEAFRADVPDGKYSVYLYLAELETNDKEASVYNLGNEVVGSTAGEREFDISINGAPIVKALNLARDYGVWHPVILKAEVTVSEGKGLSVDFIPRKSKPVLNAIRIYKNY